MSSRLGLWAAYYKYYQVVFSSLLLLTLWRHDCGFLLPAFCWFAYSLYWAWPAKPIEGAENFNAIIVGAGFSGIELGRKLNECGLKYVILEKSSGLGGTWYDNRYPGAACDVTSHLYSLSSLPNPFWSRGYSGQAEIKKYLEDFAQHFEVTTNIRFNSKVTDAVWLEDEHKWKITTDKGDTMEANFLISGAGALHVPSTPDFKGKSSFSGTSFHTAQWPDGYDVAGKNVAVIGTGASGVQVIPSIADRVKTLTVFQRTPAWVPMRHNWHFPQWLKWVFAVFPPLMTLHRYAFFWLSEALFPFIFSAGTSWFKRHFDAQLRKSYNVVKDPAVRKKLIPTYESGCKRITPHNSYAPTYNKPNVKLVTEKMEEITPKGIRTADGQEYELDTIIFATGFDILKSANAAKITGVGGTDWANLIGDTPAAFNGVVIPNFPNAFVLLGPNTGLGHNTVVFMIECQATYIVSCLRKLIEAGGKSMNCRAKPMQRWIDYVYAELDKKVWSTSCKSWYKNEKGISFVLWPNGLIEYWWRLLSCDMADYKIQD